MPCCVMVTRRTVGSGNFAWKLGDPVEVREGLFANLNLGLQEVPSAGKFWYIEIPDRTKTQIEPFVTAEPSDVPDKFLRLYTVDTALLSAQQQADLAANGWTSITWNEARTYIKNQRTGGNA